MGKKKLKLTIPLVKSRRIAKFQCRNPLVGSGVPVTLRVRGSKCKGTPNNQTIDCRRKALPRKGYLFLATGKLESRKEYGKLSF